MKHRLVPFLLLFILSACGRHPRLPREKIAPLDLAQPVNFSVEQRSSSVLPGSGGRILLTLDDVTMNQVMTSLAWNNGEVLVAARSLHSGETLNFSLGGHEYLLRLQRLENHLIGMDYAYFELREASPSRLGVSSLDADIQGLYAAMRAKTGIHFVRNGKNYDVETAIAHLERKRAAAGASIRTIEDFIEQIGSRSSQSGETYKILYPDGTEYDAGKWMRQQITK